MPDNNSTPQIPSNAPPSNEVNLKSWINSLKDSLQAKHPCAVCKQTFITQIKILLPMVKLTSSELIEIELLLKS